MPPVPREEDKVVLTPVGDRQWRESFVSKESRSPNGIIGLLIRRNYPGIVTYKGSRVAAHKVCHYSVVPEPTPNSTQQPTSALHKIETKFWYYFKWADGKEVGAKRVVRNVIKNLLPNAFYEARLQSIIAYHRHVRKVYISRSEACKMYPPVQQYMQAIPYWFATCPNAWRMLAEMWNTPEWIAKSRAGRARKEKKLRIHRQGSASAARYQRNMEKKLKRPVPEIEAYLMARTEEGKDYADIDAHDNVMAYAEACEALHGPDFEWDKEPIDGVAAYKAGHGKKHGRYLVGDGMISTPTVLREVRVSSTAGEPTDQPPPPQQRRRLNPEEAQQIEQHMHEEMERWRQQEHEVMERKLQQEREEMERKLQQEREDMERKMQQKHAQMEQKLQQEREAWESEIQPEREYYKTAISAITERLQMDLPPPPRPQPGHAIFSHPST